MNQAEQHSKRKAMEKKAETLIRQCELAAHLIECQGLLPQPGILADCTPEDADKLRTMADEGRAALKRIRRETFGQPVNKDGWDVPLKPVVDAEPEVLAIAT